MFAAFGPFSDIALNDWQVSLVSNGCRPQVRQPRMSALFHLASHGAASVSVASMDAAP
jgi:hypothetical protein